ncbi:MAG: hypothetical protein COA99_09980 [Moraxellaceae bacterium]|nr:MAG: hypothetical protein COA99_09980 [Moraxellaceae bacterium]
MATQVKDIMSTEIISVTPDIGLDILEQELSQNFINGAPVIDNGKVVGVVSRADIIRQLNIEHTFAAAVYDYYEGAFLAYSQEDETNKLGAFVGGRMEHLTVKDIMNRSIKSISPELTITEAASLMMEYRVHRLLVIGEQLEGILSTTDYVRLCAEGNSTL